MDIRLAFQTKPNADGGCQKCLAKSGRPVAKWLSKCDIIGDIISGQPMCIEEGELPACCCDQSPEIYSTFMKGSWQGENRISGLSPYRCGRCPRTGVAQTS